LGTKNEIYDHKQGKPINHRFILLTMYIEIEENHLFTPDELPTYITKEEECAVNSAAHQD